MALTINTNVASLNAQRNLGASQSNLNTAMQRLSSGLRINSAKDDAAGLAISDRMTAQIRGLNQAARNANDGISLAQTAEGALQESTNILQRMRELSVQSANDTNSASDRASLNDELTQLKEELDRIAQTTEFNGTNLLDGSMSGEGSEATFQVGANAGENQVISFGVDSAMAKDLSDVGTTIDAPNGTPISGQDINGAIAAGELKINGNSIGAAEADAVSLTNAISAADETVTAEAVNVQSFNFSDVDMQIDQATASGTAMTAPTDGSDLSINGTNVSASDNAAELATNIELADSSVTATATNQQSLAFEEVAIGKAQIDSSTAVLGALSAGNLEVNGTDIGAVAVGSGNLAQDVANAIEAADSAVTAEVGETSFTAGAFTTTADGTYSLSIEGVQIFDGEAAGVTAADVHTAVTSTYADELEAAGVTVAGANGNSLVFSKADGSDLNIEETLGAGASEGGFANGINDVVGTTQTDTYGSVDLTSLSDITLSGDSENQAGFTNDQSDAAGGYSLTVDGNTVDVSSANADGRVTAGEIATAINSLEGYTASEHGESVNITKEDGSNIEISNTVTNGDTNNSTGTAFSDDTHFGSVSLESASDIVIAGDDPTVAGFDAGTYESSGGSYTISLGGSDISVVPSESGQVTAQDVADSINGALFTEGEFSASVSEDGGVDITKTDAGTSSSFTLSESVIQNGSELDASAGLEGVDSSSQTYEGQVQLDSDADIVFTGDSDALEAAGLNNTGNATTTIDQLSVASREDAETAISSVDSALSMIDTIRGELGAVQNRFESTIANLNNVSENLSAARSRILDADIAQETSAMTKNNILQQAGVSILAQANQAPQLALSLLQ